jgi:hypothetical protein
MRRRLFALTLCCAALNAGCFEFFNSSGTQPSPTINLMGGQWVSASADATSLVTSCTNFVWNATEKTATSASGTFSATCFNVVQVSGTAQGSISGSFINWSASGSSVGGPTGTCPISISGTATVTESQIQIPFTGSTCLGPVSGTEILTKK